MSFNQWNNLNSGSNAFNNDQFNQYSSIYPINNRDKSQFTSPQLNGSFATFDSIDTMKTLRRSGSETFSPLYLPPQYAIIPFMTKLQNEMNQLLYLIEIEKTKLPPNINLIQFYIHLHAHKIQQFKLRIPWLPITYHQYRPYHHSKILPFEDYCQQRLNNEPITIKIPPSKIQNQSNKNNANDINNVSPDSNHHSIASNNSNISNNINRAIAQQITCAPATDVDTLKRAYSKQSLTSTTITMSRSLSKQSIQSPLPATPTPSTVVPYPLSDDKPYIIIKYNNNNDECQAVEQCQCVQNIIRALLFYQKSQNEEEVDKFFMDKYTNLLNDFHHILSSHLDCDTESNNKQFELIHNEFSKYIYCDISHCQQYKRNEQSREDKLMNINGSIVTDFLDTIHCYFIHSFDTAYRIKNKDQIKHHIKDIHGHANEEKKQHLNEINEYDCQDFQVENLQKYQNKKRCNLRNISGLGRRIKHYKFCTAQDENYEESQNIKMDVTTSDDTTSIISFADTESIVSLASLASIASTVNSYTSSTLSQNLRPHENTYSFGHRFYYWNYYIEKMEKDHWNDGYTFSQWHIPARYNNLKEELLYNKIHRLDKCKYNVALQKAQRLMTADIFKSKKCDTKFFEERYGIQKYDTMSLEHVMSLLFYTDYDELCYQFSKTFRKKCPSETYKSLKKRNSNYANWSRLLRESIECFGQKMKTTKIKIFYHGVSHMVLNSLVCRFCGPTSTTPQIEVATIFSKRQGIILELEKYSDNLRYFNCSLVSCYANEDERLFFGGFHELNIRSVHEIKQDGPPLNYRKFIRALSIFNQAIDGKRHIRINKVKAMDYSIINKLIKHQLVSISVIDGIEDEIYSNNFPDYINSCFNQLVQTKKKIKINLHWLNRAYRGFSDVFIDKKIQNLVLFDVIGSIFYSCTDLTVSMDQFDAARNITKKYLIYLVQILKRLNNIYHSKLRKIKIERIKQGFSKQELLQQQFVFNGANWKLEIQKNSGEASSNILLTNLNMKRSTKV